MGSQYAEHAGGKGVNQAVAASRSGARVAFVGAVGGDGAGLRLRQTLVDNGVEVSHLATVAEPTGRALIVVDDFGENSIVVVPGANAVSGGAESFPPATVILAQLEVPVDLVVRAFGSANDSTRILNPAPAMDLPPALISATDIVVPNEHELELIGGPAPLLAAGCDAVVVTRGGDGVDVVTRDGTKHLDAFSVDVIDTTGAGDAFCGALASQLASGTDLLSAVRWATAAGALATTVVGAVPSQPSASAIRALLLSLAGVS